MERAKCVGEGWDRIGQNGSTGHWLTEEATQRSVWHKSSNPAPVFKSPVSFCVLFVANLDFEARVPVPFSIFPSTYRESESHTQTVTETKTHEEVEIKPQQPQAGREGQYSSVSVTAEQVPPRGEQRFSEEEVRITREEERYRRPGVQKFDHEEEHFTIREDSRRPEPPSQYQPSQYQPPSQYQTSHTHVEVDTHRHPYYSTPIDLAEREYRQRYRPAQAFSTEDPTSHSHSHYQTQDNFQANNYTVEGRPAPQFYSSEKTEINNFTVDGRSSHPQYKTTEKTELNNFTVDGRSSRPQYTSKETEINKFTVDGRSSHPQYKTTEKIEINDFTVDGRSSQPQYRDTKTTQVNKFTVDTPVPRPSNKKDVRFSEEIVETTKVDNKSKMGYYDDDGHYHSFRAGAHKLGDRIGGGRRDIEIDIHEGPRPSADCLPNTVSIPCHHIRLGDFLMLQGRPCQVIRISTSSATGQYRYLGVDLFTKQLHEESSFISNPAPSVVVQSMLGPVFKQYRVLDMQEGQIVAMTETGDVKQGLPVIDQSNLYSRLSSAFESGRGSVRVLVLNDGARELAVDMKVIHGSRL
ncbi:woronin body major precursor [Fusarium beomiforme]|uniref:Woronin body major n=1 Tax=Fusarium beomiforme TaxID=44412 RepID=A0A9P5ABJ5_9HYPO|nr:woronin body major precursor [Fusarium beomiforme]